MLLISKVNKNSKTQSWAGTVLGQFPQIHLVQGLLSTLARVNDTCVTRRCQISLAKILNKLREQ